MSPLRDRFAALLATFYPDLRITRSFPLFSTHCGSNRKIRAALIVHCANEIFPALGRLLDVTGGRAALAAMTSRDLCAKPEDLARAGELSDLFLRHGSDKSSSHDYHKIYGALLTRREEPLRLLEIGLGSSDPAVVSNMGRGGRPGASLRAFRDFLPRAEIYGADIDPKTLFTEDRIRTFPVDQTDPAALERLGDAIGGKFDLIIDDGLHPPGPTSMSSPSPSAASTPEAALSSRTSSPRISPSGTSPPGFSLPVIRSGSWPAGPVTCFSSVERCDARPKHPSLTHEVGK